MAVLHVVHVTIDLQFVVQSGNNDVQAVSNQSDLLVEFGIASQGIDGHCGELGEMLLGAGSFLEELDEEGGDDAVAVSPDVFPAPLDVANLMGSHFSLGISQIFGFPTNLHQF